MGNRGGGTDQGLVGLLAACLLPWVAIEAISAPSLPGDGQEPAAGVPQERSPGAGFR